VEYPRCQEIFAADVQTAPLLNVLFAALFLAFTVAHAQQPAPLRLRRTTSAAHYTKYEFRIPMRDGKHLFTAVYVPKEAAGDPIPS